MQEKKSWLLVVTLVLLTGCVANQSATSPANTKGTTQPVESDIGARTGGAKAPTPAPTPSQSK